MLRVALLAGFALLTIVGPASAQAQNSDFYIGAWRDLPIDRAPAANRVVLHHIEIAPLPTLRPPRQFTIRMWARCASRPSEACELGTVTGAERTLRDGSPGIYVDGTPPRGGLRLACLFNMLLASAYVASDPTNPESHKAGIDYRITPSSGHCPGAQLVETIGTMDRMVTLARPPVSPTTPALPPRRN